MKTLRLVIGILSCALVLIVLFQSCTATFVTSFGENQDDMSGAVGMVFAIIIMSAGITAIAGRNSRGATIAATLLYLLAALIGIVEKGVYKDLQVWAFVSFGFGITFAISLLVEGPRAKKPVYEVSYPAQRVEAPEPETEMNSATVEGRYTAATASPIVGTRPKDPWFVSAIRITGIVEAVVGVFIAVVIIRDLPPERFANMYLHTKEMRVVWYGVSGAVGFLWAMTSFIIAGVISDVHAIRAYLAGYSIK